MIVLPILDCIINSVFHLIVIDVDFNRGKAQSTQAVFFEILSVCYGWHISSGKGFTGIFMPP
jgi:hypothetical protein